MSKFDYYKILNLGREYSQEDIAESYRKLSLKKPSKIIKRRKYSNRRIYI